MSYIIARLSSDTIICTEDEATRAPVLGADYSAPLEAIDAFLMEHRRRGYFSFPSRRSWASTA